MFDFAGDDICSSRHGGAPASTATHERVKHTYGPRCREVLKVIITSGFQGATLDQVCIALGKMPHALSPRITQLKRGRLIVGRGTRPTRSGCPATVYFATLAGEQALTAGGAARA